MALKFSVDYPDSLPDALNESPEQFEREAKMAMAVKLYELKRISSGVAARLVEMDRISFLLRLHEFGVPLFDFDEAELVDDISNA